MQAYLADVDFVARNGSSQIRLFVKTRNGKSARLYVAADPYFLFLPFDSKKPLGDYEKISVS
ncbi:hypothetical protein HY993_04665, partial [Candidatus Micrarchaeota archaeon]|nr:hypothetical protein [Candidatus Micrarchaeota archaeon]